MCFLQNVRLIRLSDDHAGLLIVLDYCLQVILLLCIVLVHSLYLLCFSNLNYFLPG